MEGFFEILAREAHGGGAVHHDEPAIGIEGESAIAADLD